MQRAGVGERAKNRTLVNRKAFNRRSAEHKIWHEPCESLLSRPRALEPSERRYFLKSVTGVAAGSTVLAPAIWSAAKADARTETLLIVSESGPNSDIHGIGTNVPGTRCHGIATTGSSATK